MSNAFFLHLMTVEPNTQVADAIEERFESFDGAMTYLEGCKYLIRMADPQVGDLVVTQQDPVPVNDVPEPVVVYRAYWQYSESGPFKGAKEKATVWCSPGHIKTSSLPSMQSLARAFGGTLWDHPDNQNGVTMDVPESISPILSLLTGGVPQYGTVKDYLDNLGK